MMRPRYLCYAKVVASVKQLQGSCIKGGYAEDLSGSIVRVLKKSFGDVYAIQDGYDRYWYLKKEYLVPLEGSTL